MTNYTFGDLGKWGAKQKGALDIIVKVATNDLMASIPIKFGINKQGFRVDGSVVWDEGDLAKSLTSWVAGQSLQGPDSYEAIAKLMKAGDEARFWWDSPYALAVHNGTETLEGTHWVERAIVNWPKHVENAVATAERSA